MTPKHLIVILLAQCALVALVWLPDLQDTELEPFLQFDAAQVHSIEITTDESALTIAQQPAKNNRWWLKALDLPADANQINALIKKIAAAGASSWPVTTSSSAHERFELTKDNYQRLIRFKDGGGDELAALYLGTSPGFGKVHARLAGESEIHAIEFNNFEAEAEASAWIDGGLLQPLGELKFLARTDEHNSWSIRVENDKWQSTEEIALNEEKLNAFLGHFKELAVTGIADKEPSGQRIQFRLIDDTGAHEISFFDPGEEAAMVTKSNRYTQLFTVPHYLYELLNISVNKLQSTTQDTSSDDTSAATQDNELPPN